MQLSCRLYNDMKDDVVKIEDYHFIDREGNYIASPDDERDLLPKDDALGFVVMSHSSCDSFDDGYPVCSDLEQNIDDAGIEDVITKAEFAKLYQLFERELMALKYMQWMEKKTEGVIISSLWESEYRSSQGHEDLYPDVDLDIRLLGTIREYMKEKK